MVKPASAWIVLLGTVLTLTITAAAQSPGVTSSETALHSSTQARLRQALPFPEASLSHKMALSLGIGFSPERGFYLQTGAEAAEASLRAQALRRTLHGEPHEASCYELLAKYERYLGQEAHAKRDFTRAATLYHQQTIGRTSSTHTETALVGRSRALGEIGQSRKAEIELRQALRSHPRTWRLWGALGNVKLNQAEATLSNTTRGDTAAITRALRIDDDACACFNRAIKVAPRQGFAYAARGEYLGFDRPSLRDDVKRLRGAARSSFEMTVASAALPDFRTAARLLPSNPYAIAYPVWQEVSDIGFFHLHLPFPSQAAWRAMPVSTKRAASGAIQQLTRLSRSPNKRLARRADVALGFLLFETQRAVIPSETALRRGLLGPDHQEAAEMLMHVMSLENQYGQLASFCKAQAQRHDKPRLPVIAAWAEIERMHWPAAQTQIEQALTLEPDDPSDLLTLAVIKIKEGRVGGTVALLEKAKASLTYAPLEIKATEQTELEVVCAFNEALSGRPENAKMEFRAILVRDPRNVGAVYGLAILEHE